MLSSPTAAAAAAAPSTAAAREGITIEVQSPVPSAASHTGHILPFQPPTKETQKKSSSVMKRREVFMIIPFYLLVSSS